MLCLSPWQLSNLEKNKQATYCCILLSLSPLLVFCCLLVIYTTMSGPENVKAKRVMSSNSAKHYLQPLKVLFLLKLWLFSLIQPGLRSKYCELPGSANSSSQDLRLDVLPDAGLRLASASILKRISCTRVHTQMQRHGAEISSATSAYHAAWLLAPGDLMTHSPFPGCRHFLLSTKARD